MIGRSDYRICFLALAFIQAGCNPLLEKKELKKLNPTDFVFPGSLQEVRGAAMIELGKMEEFDLYSAEFPSLPFDTTSIFELPGNSQDLYVRYADYYVSRNGFNKSFIYPRNDYIASYQLHFTSIDSSKTRIAIVTHKPRIILGKAFLPSGPHFVRVPKYADVAPSTIEEYQILYKLGKAMNLHMPEVLYPE